MSIVRTFCPQDNGVMLASREHDRSNPRARYGRDGDKPESWQEQAGACCGQDGGWRQARVSRDEDKT